MANILKATPLWRSPGRCFHFLWCWLLLIWARIRLVKLRRVDPNALIIKVKAQQFAWTFEYPEYGIVSNELHLPVDQQVVLEDGI